MKKIDIIDCCNENHKITMMISDNCMDFADDVYNSIFFHKGLSSRQIIKLEAFRKSCKGPYMVQGYHFFDNEADYVVSRVFDWCRYNVYVVDDNVFIEYTTRVQGDRPFVVKIAKYNYHGLNKAIEDIQKDPGCYYFIGPKVY